MGDGITDCQKTFSLLSCAQCLFVEITRWGTPDCQKVVCMRISLELKVNLKNGAVFLSDE